MTGTVGVAIASFFVGVVVGLGLAVLFIRSMIGSAK